MRFRFLLVVSLLSSNYPAFCYLSLDFYAFFLFLFSFSPVALPYFIFSFPLLPSSLWRCFLIALPALTLLWRIFDFAPRRFGVSFVDVYLTFSPRRIGVSLLTSIWRCLSPFWRLSFDVYLTFPLAALAFLFWRLSDVVCPSPIWRFCSDVSLTPYTPRHFWRFIGRLTAAEVWSPGIQPICITF